MTTPRKPHRDPPPTCHVMFFEAPCEMMNSFSASTFSPRRSMPCTVGMRGSSQPSTRPVSTNHVSLRFDSTVLTKLSLGRGEGGAGGGGVLEGPGGAYKLGAQYCTNGMYM